MKKQSASKMFLISACCFGVAALCSLLMRQWTFAGVWTSLSVVYFILSQRQTKK